MAKKRKGWEIEVTIVPPGTLPPNPHHPLAHLTEEERLEGFYRALGNLLLSLPKEPTGKANLES